ncbi:MAG: PASTA domain-containing protein, partial [Oscillibacter sp.]|nr:PASTA domain-containing protein [Oscillibacter sp.]
NITDMTVLAAKAAMKSLIEKYELTIDDSEEYQEFNDEIEKGHIIRTYPEKGEPLKKGDTIQVVVSKGPEVKDVKVLKFIGINIETARNQLETLGLVCEDTDIEVVPSTETIGTIVWQSLEPNTMAKEGDTIKFQVSSGSSISQPSYGSGILTDNYKLPKDGRKEVHVEVYVSREPLPQFDQVVSCDQESVQVTLRGSGEQEIRVYFDGELEHSYIVQFQE